MYIVRIIKKTILMKLVHEKLKRVENRGWHSPCEDYTIKIWDYHWVYFVVSEKIWLFRCDLFEWTQMSEIVICWRNGEETATLIMWTSSFTWDKNTELHMFWQTHMDISQSITSCYRVICIRACMSLVQ